MNFFHLDDQKVDTLKTTLPDPETLKDLKYFPADFEKVSIYSRYSLKNCFQPMKLSFNNLKIELVAQTNTYIVQYSIG